MSDTTDYMNMGEKEGRIRAWERGGGLEIGKGKYILNTEDKQEYR